MKGFGNLKSSSKFLSQPSLELNRENCLNIALKIYLLSAWKMSSSPNRTGNSKNHLSDSCRFKKENTFFILGVSDSECPTCCQSETILKELQELFHLDKFLYKGKRIPIARMDISKGNLLEKDMITFESVPKIVIYK